jgi:hypothetical protein
VSRDPLGSDPLGLDPVTAISQVNQRSKTQDILNAMRHNIALRGLYICPDATGPLEPVGPPIGDDGKVLTLEERQRIAASRAPYVPVPFGEHVTRLADGTMVDIGATFRADLRDRVVEPLGKSAQAEIDKMPEIRILTPREAKIPDEPKE